MDYGKQGAAKVAKKGPKHTEHNQYGSDKTPFGSRPSKEELLARMKDAQAKGGESSKDLDRPADASDHAAEDEGPVRAPAKPDHAD
jgi:hypothetical protein